MHTRAECEEQDARDPLAALRDQFALARHDADGLIYLDGNSLGVLPKKTAARVAEVVNHEWGQGLIRSWNSAGWIALAQRIGDKIAPLVGAGPGDVVVADSTSVNLYKVLIAAVASLAASPTRRHIASERTNFPTDLYIADSVARATGHELVLIEDGDALGACLDDRLAVLLLTHVNFRTGRMHSMSDVTRAAHAAGALMVWDLAHSAGVVPVDLNADGDPAASADFAVGCGYKYLNGGPGAPAFAWAHPRHTARMDRDRWRPPLAGWMGHAAPFEFTPDYRPATGMTRFLAGTPPVLSMAALECGVDSVLAAQPVGGIMAIRAKSVALTDLFIEQVEAKCAGRGLALASPRDGAERGSHVSFAHATHGYAIMQALIARGVIGDFRAPDLLRFGFTPLYTRFVDAWDAADRLAEVLASGVYREPRYRVRQAVT